MQDKNDPTNRPTGRLNVPDDIKELFYRALKRAGYPAASLESLRKHDDPRPRLTLPDGTEIIAQYVPPLPPFERVDVEFLRLVAETIPLPTYGAKKPGISARQYSALKERRENLRRAILETYGSDACAMMGAMVWFDSKEDEDARDRLYRTLADPPDPADAEAFDAWWRKAWRKVCATLYRPLERAVLGETPRRGEGKVREVFPAKRDPDTGRLVPLSEEDLDNIGLPALEDTRPSVEAHMERAEIREQLEEAGHAMRAEMPKAAEVYLARLEGLERKPPALTPYAEIVERGLAPTKTTARDHWSAAKGWVRDHRPELQDFLVA